jgi:2-aminoethylphosphonate aminotransferase
MKHVKRNVLLTPGPATTTDSVKFAQVVPDICPREKVFGSLMEYVCLELTRIVADPADYGTVLFGGSGTAAVESIVSTVVGPEDSIVIVNNGAYGKRMCEIAEAFGLNVTEFKSPPQALIDLSALELFIQILGRTPTHLAVVHHETTTGLLNDIAAIGKLCAKYHIDMIVDAISSFAAVPIRMKDMNIRYLAASSNKCIQGMAGVSFVIAEKSKLENRSGRKPSNYYLNLYAQYKFFSQTGQMRFTPPVQTLYALKQAINELKQEGLKERNRRYAKSWETLIAGIGRLGLTYIGSEEHHSMMVTSIVEPDFEGYDFYEMHDYLYSNGFTIYPGKLEERNTFRIANIGDITSKDIEALLKWLEIYFQKIGFYKRREDDRERSEKTQQMD